MTERLRAIGGPVGDLRFVCPWCGARFADRVGPASLEQHWGDQPECRRNRGVNNQTQSKYDVRDDLGLRLPDRGDRDA